MNTTAPEPFAPHESCDDWLRKWDEGLPVPSVEMGGIGPGYEQCIQVCTVEFVRAISEFPIIDPSKFWTMAEQTEKRTAIQKLQITGAQFGAAANLAYRILRDGPEAAVESAPEDRRILVSKGFPT